MRTSWIVSCLFSVAAVAFGQPPLTGNLPTGLRAQVRLLDFVDTEHQSAGYAFRAVVEGDITVGDKVVVPDKSGVLLRLVPDPAVAAGGLTLEWWAIKIDGEWSEFRGLSGGTGLFTVLVSGGPVVHVPMGTKLQLELRRPLHLINVGRLRL